MCRCDSAVLPCNGFHRGGQPQGAPENPFPVRPSREATVVKHQSIDKNYKDPRLRRASTAALSCESFTPAPLGNENVFKVL